jgi:hypothetical protein
LEKKILTQGNWVDLDDLDNLKTMQNNLAAIQQKGVPADQKETFDDLQTRANTLWNQHVTSTETKTTPRTSSPTTTTTTTTTKTATTASSTKSPSTTGSPFRRLFNAGGGQKPTGSPTGKDQSPTQLRSTSADVYKTSADTVRDLTAEIEEAAENRPVISDAEWFGTAAEEQKPSLLAGVVRGDIVQSDGQTIQMNKRSPELQARMDAQVAARPAKELEKFQNRFQTLVKDFVETTDDGKQKLTTPAGQGAQALLQMKSEIDAMRIYERMPEDQALKSQYNTLYNNIMNILMYREPLQEGQPTTQAAAAQSIPQPLRREES